MSVKNIFDCKRCGFCCQGQTTISLNADDQRNMLAVLGISRKIALERYWNDNGVEIQMKTKDGHCVFYNDGCEVHSGRPWRCRQWPLVSAILVDEVNLQTIMESCPGIKRPVSYDEICVAVKEEIWKKNCKIEELSSVNR